VAALGTGSSSEGRPLGEGAGAASLTEGSLVTPGSPTEGEQSQAQEQAKLASPEAVAAREASRIEFEGLDAEQAAKAAGEAFPKLVDEPAGGPPKLPAGQSITGYVSDNAASVDLGEGKHGVLESIEPIAVQTSSGQRTPIDLGLSDDGSSFQPTTSAVEISIPKRLSDGVQLPSMGVSLTPVDGSGAPLGGSEGLVDGASVLYANTQTDMDSLVKPTTAGFAADTLLRSVESPQQLFFRVGLPAGASLVQANDGSGAVEVLEEGATIATILPPGAQDAAGTSVPVSMSISGDTLALNVADHSAEYQYPIEVDPEINDHQLVEESGKHSNWKFEPTSTAKFGHEPHGSGSGEHGCPEAGKAVLETCGIAEYGGTEKAFWAYQTQGVSKIFEVSSVKTEGKNKGAEIESFLELEHGGVDENKYRLSTETFEPEYSLKETPVGGFCAKNGEKVECTPAAGTAGNTVRFQQSVQKAPSNYKFSDSLHEAIVHLSEPAGTHSTTSENTTTPEFEVEVEKEGKKEKQTRKNALDGTKNWLSEYDGAIQFIAKDTGIGVSSTRLEYESSAGSGKWEQLPEHNYLGECQGMQCSPEQKEYWTLNTKLPNGEDNIRYRAEEAMGDEKHETESLTSEGTATVKVDHSKPHNIVIGGLPYGNELREGHYELTVYVTDGEGSTIASSGVKSTTMSVDGKSLEDNEIKKKETKEAGKKEGECAVPKGECIATAKYSIEGAELGAGHHSIQVVAFDNAGNEGRLPGGATEISIRHSTPVALGPGSVDLESGDFSLGASDVSMGSGLTLSRAFSSRATEEGDEGALGPEWSMSMASTESLVEIPDGSLLITLANGGQAIFAKPLAGVKCESGSPFESPPGDSNLKLWCEENKTTKAREAYYLEDAADHTKVKFTLPTGGFKAWVPTVQEGTVSTDTVTYKYQTVEGQNEYALAASREPVAITSGSDGNLWFTEGGPENNKIVKSTTTGTATEYSLPSGSWADGIARGTEGDVWWVDANTDKIGKVTPSGVITEYEGYGGNEQSIATSSEGDLWYTASDGIIGKVTPSGVVTHYGEVGDKKDPANITAGPEGDMWFSANEGCNTERSCKIGKITPSGEISEYAVPTEYGWMEGMTAAPNGEKALWYTSGERRIRKITTAGVIAAEYALPAGSDPRGITAGPDGNVWFTDRGSSKIGKITPSGAITEYPLPSGSDPGSITVGPDNNLWFIEGGTDKIAEITTAGVITEPTEARAAVPSGVSCSWTVKPTEMKPGCRALEFTYAKETTAKGEGETEWGEYIRRLTKVRFVGYNPATKKMEEPVVAEYSYDSLGRLRAEWDPRLTTPLKTTYGYDEYGRVTALNPPGQEPWSLTYGTSTGDFGTGRLVKATRAPASGSLWGGEVVKNTEAAKITGSPVVGVRLAVSSGKWSGTPLTYGYQWEECNSESQCTAILGADNANYTPVAGNVGHTLVAQVTATNGGGSGVTVTTGTAAVTGGSVTQSVDSGNSLNAVSCVPATTDCVLSDSKGNAFYATNVSTASGATWKSWAGPTGESPSQAAACPTSSLCLLADGKGSAGGYMYYATSLGGAWTNAFEPSYGVDAISCASSSFCIDGQGESGGYIRYSTSPGSTSWTAEDIGGSTSIKGVFCLSSSFCTAVDNVGDVYVATSTTQIESATWTKTNVDGTSALNGVACTSTTSCVVVDGAGNAIDLAISEGKATATKHNIDGTNSLTAITCTGSSTCVTVDNAGNVFGSKNGGETWTKVYALGDKLTSVSCASTTLCATVDTTGNVIAFNPAGATGTEGELHSPGPGATIDYNVPVKGSEAPYNMSEAEVAKWGQKAQETPFEATAIFPPDSPQGWPASSYTRATIDYLDENGRLVNTANPSTGKYGAISTSEYNEYNDVVRTLTPDNRATALEAGETESAKVASLLSTVSQYNEPNCRKETDEKEKEVAEPGTRLCESWGPEHKIKDLETKPSEVLARNHTKYYYEDIANGAPEEIEGKKQAYDLVTETQDLAQWFSSAGKSEGEVESRRSTISYSGQSGLGWTLRVPTSITAATETGGAKVTHTTLYNKETGQITETRGPEGSAGESAHDKKVIYYSSEENKEGYGACGKHPEWNGLVCESVPAKQPPETTGVPKLPETTTTYNMWNEPETVVETFPKSGSFAEYTRTTKDEYDAAGRMKSSEETSTATTETADKALPKVTNVYNEKTGVLEKQSTTVGEKTKTITSAYNTLGQLETYTDADGNVAKFKYGTPEKDGLLEEMSDSSDEGISSQKYTYSTSTKQLTQLVDSAAGTFTASYDTEGKLASEVFPNGMCANYTDNSAGEATHIEYTKTSSCSEKEGVWFSETKVPSVRGEAMSRASTLASEEYGYDTLGRLTEVKETPSGEYCKTRIYKYDEESNRTSLTKYEPNSKKECATEGGTEEKHTYDEANRLTDSGMTYDALGNVTKLPSGDAEGHALESTFYVDNAVATQTQNGVTNDYYMDPDGRVRETINGAKKAITHYDGSGEAVAWTCEGAEKAEKCESTAKWTRNIPGIDGTLTAIQNGTGAVVETPILQLHDLQGDVVATIKDKAGEAKLESTYNSTEFGVPNGGKEPPKFAWLGAGGIEKSLASGVITEGATSYVPQTGRALQSEEVAPPGLPEGSGGDGPYTFELSPSVMQGATREANEAPGIGLTEEREAVEAACRANPESCAQDPHHSDLYEEKGLRELAAIVRHTAGDVVIVGEVLTLLPDVGDLIGASADAYSDWLGQWADTFERYAGDAEAERDSGEIFRDRYLVHESYLAIHIDAFFFTINIELPYSFSITACYWDQYIGGRTYYNCGEEGTWSIPGLGA